MISNRFGDSSITQILVVFNFQKEADFDNKSETALNQLLNRWKLMLDAGKINCDNTLSKIC